MDKERDKITLKVIQISDTHLTAHRDLLEPMVDAINQEVVDLVIVTGDVISVSDDESLFKKAVETLNRIRHRVIVLPGDYDCGDLWKEYFGDSHGKRMHDLSLNGYRLLFLDTSFMGHRYAVGWGDVLKKEDPEQYEWLKGQLKNDAYHIVFSHHPLWVHPTAEGDEYITDTMRAVYSGHLHEPIKFYFKYTKPREHFDHGFSCVPMKFHGSSCYLLILAKANGEVVNVPRIVNAKKTAW